MMAVVLQMTVPVNVVAALKKMHVEYVVVMVQRMLVVVVLNPVHLVVMRLVALN
jgi:hypothetical protein